MKISSQKISIPKTEALPSESPIPLPAPPSENPRGPNPDKKLRSLENSRNYDFSGRTGGAWDLAGAPDFHANSKVGNAFLRQINNSIAGAATLVNVVNNAAGFLLVDTPRLLEEHLVSVGGPSFEEMAVAARSATPTMPLDDLACYGMARIAALSRRIRPQIFPTKLRLDPRALRHIQTRHLHGWPESLPKSLFFPNVNLEDLLKNAGKTPRAVQRGGQFERVVQAGSYVGIDRKSLQATSVYSVITTARENLVTMFPGKP